VYRTKLHSRSICDDKKKSILFYKVVKSSLYGGSASSSSSSCHEVTLINYLVSVMQICKIVHVHINPSFLVLSYLLHARTIIIVVVVFVVIIIIIIIIIMCGVCSSYGGDKCMK
jgi:hypothetical protein